jgi:hypothetical protein
MIASYNASIANFYSATGSLSRYKNKDILFYFEKNALAYYNAGVVAVGLAPVLITYFGHKHVGT